MLFRVLKEILNQKIYRKNQQGIKKKAAVDGIYIIVLFTGWGICLIHNKLAWLEVKSIWL